MYYNISEIAQYTQGCVVRRNYSDDIGHVMSFSLNPHEEVIVVVQWADGVVTKCHPSNITKLV